MSGESPAMARKQLPVNHANRLIDETLVNLCSKGPSFVPTPLSIDWNDLQESWLKFKQKVRWRSFFFRREVINEGEGNVLAALRVKSGKEPPMSNVPAIEVFLSNVEKELFKVGNVKKIKNNLTSSERIALKNFRNTPVCERDLYSNSNAG